MGTIGTRCRLLLFRSLILCLILFAGQVSANPDLIRIATREYPPFTSKELPHQGVISHIVRESFRQVGVNVEFGFFPQARMHEYVVDGKDFKNEIWHAAVPYVFNNDMTQKLHYSISFISVRSYLYYLKSSPIEWEDIHDLSGKTIGLSLHTYHPLLEVAQRNDIVKLNKNGQYNALFKRLLHSKVHAVVMAGPTARYVLESEMSEAERDRIARDSHPITSFHYHLVASKSTSQGERLVELFNQGYLKLRDSGKYHQIMRDFESGYYNR